MVTFNSVITLLVFSKIYFKCALDECNLNAKIGKMVNTEKLNKL